MGNKWHWEDKFTQKTPRQLSDTISFLWTSYNYLITSGPWGQQPGWGVAVQLFSTSSSNSKGPPTWLQDKSPISGRRMGLGVVFGARPQPPPPTLRNNKDKPPEQIIIVFCHSTQFTLFSTIVHFRWTFFVSPPGLSKNFISSKLVTTYYQLHI